MEDNRARELRYAVLYGHHFLIETDHNNLIYIMLGRRPRLSDGLYCCNRSHMRFAISRVPST